MRHRHLDEGARHQLQSSSCSARDEPKLSLRFGGAARLVPSRRREWMRQQRGFRVAIMSWYCRPTNWSQECVPANWMPLVPGLGCEIAIISLRCEMSELLDAEDGVQPTSKLCCKASGVAFGYRLQRQLQVALSPRLITTCSIVAAPSVVGRGVARRRSDVPTLRRLFARDSQIIVSESSGAALWPKLCDLSQMVASQGQIAR